MNDPVGMYQRVPILGGDLPILEMGNGFTARPSGLLISAEAVAAFERQHQFERMQREISYQLAYMQMMLTGSRFKTEPEPEVDTSRSEPFVGFKTLAVHRSKTGKYGLVGMYGGEYPVDAHAKCGSGGKHTAPDWGCSCGFYALNTAPLAPEYGRFIAEVELFGKVIEGEYGWRASRQRVLSLQAFQTCVKCTVTAVGFRVARKGNVVPVCHSHSLWRRITLAQLTAAIGTEVRWLDSKVES